MPHDTNSLWHYRCAYCGVRHITPSNGICTRGANGQIFVIDNNNKFSDSPLHAMYYRLYVRCTCYVIFFSPLEKRYPDIGNVLTPFADPYLRDNPDGFQSGTGWWLQPHMSYTSYCWTAQWHQKLQVYGKGWYFSWTHSFGRPILESICTAIGQLWCISLKQQPESYNWMKHNIGSPM